MISAYKFSLIFSIIIMFFSNAGQLESEESLLKNNERFPTLEILPFLLNEFSNLMIQDKIDISVFDLGLDMGP